MMFCNVFYDYVISKNVTSRTWHGSREDCEDHARDFEKYFPWYRRVYVITARPKASAS